MSQNTVNYVESPEDTHQRCDDEALAHLEQSFLEEEYEAQFAALAAEADRQLEELEEAQRAEIEFDSLMERAAVPAGQLPF